MSYCFKLVLLVIGIHLIACSVSNVDSSSLQGFLGGGAIAVYLFLVEIDLPPI